MGKKNKIKESDLDRPLTSIYECNNLVCMKKWMFDDDKVKSSDLKQCKACNSLLTISLCHSINNNKNDQKKEMQLLDAEMNNLKVEESEHTIGLPKQIQIQPLMSIVNTNNPIITDEKGPPSNANGSKLLNDRDRNNIRCKKKFTLYECTNEDCRHQWNSVHGWSTRSNNTTNGNAPDADCANDDYDGENPLFTQRCRKIKNSTPCGNRGKILRINNENVTKKDNRAFWRRDSAGRHDKQFCDMCAKLDHHQQGMCTNKIRVNINAFNSDAETVTYFKHGPAPPPVDYIMF